MRRVVCWAVVPFMVLVWSASAWAQQASADPRVGLREGVKRDALDADGKKLYDSIVNATTPYGRGLPAPIGMWMHSPKMAEHVLPLYMYLRFGGDSGDAMYFPGQELRQAILVAARETNSQYQWTSHEPRKVAERIEYSPPTIYEHFTSKEALLLELMREGFRMLMERVRASNSAAASPEARIMAVALAYWEFAWDHPELYQVMHGLGGVPFCFDPAIEAAESAINPSNPEQFSPEAKAIFQFTMDAIKDLVGGDEQDCEEREASVHILWATLHGLVALTMAGRIEGGRAQAANLVERAVRAFLAAQRVTSDE